MKTLALRLMHERESGGYAASLDSLIRSIRRWEAGYHYPDEMSRWLIAKALGIDEEELFGSQRHIQLSPDALPTLTPIPVAPVSIPHDSSAIAVDNGTIDVTVNRREFLEQGLALAFGLPLADWGPVVSLFSNSNYIDAGGLDDLRTLTRLHMRQWCEASPTELLPKALARVQVLKGWVDRTRSLEEHRDIKLILAEAAVDAAWLSNLADNRGDARRLWVLTEELARETGDGPLRAIALAGRSCLYSPVDRGGAALSFPIDLLEGALQSVGQGASAQSRAYLHARYAEELAAIGSAREMYTNLEVADRLVDSVGAPDERLFGRLDRPQLLGFRGNCEVLLYHSAGSAQAHALDSAIEVIERALSETSPNLLPQRSAMLADLAAACAQSGEVDRATAVLSEALDIASESGLEERVQRVLTIRGRELDKWKDSAAVKEFDDRFRS
ncbi:hypothetical protein [Candidatus Nephthysia bennettiae]|uniref:Uncharacterized protein n=1 Tax=Candidatus Nephthysia bennettiae TaxID=3127016 RepID=A0A934K4D7_9BACT|nr:hypothetical protein [Candidatus Dormibacteraeota bacterium]MBJ7614273.1 hypothetical protein [Candidatus Dormibacteraeota bacterium]